MTHEDFNAENTTEYRGFKIMFGSIKNSRGEWVCAGFHPLGATPEQDASMVKSAKEWIDKQLASAP